MKRSLNPREKRLLGLCIITVLAVGVVLAFQEFTTRRKVLTDTIGTLEKQTASDRIWLNDRAFWEKRLAWLEKTMPYTASAGKAQGQLLEDLRNAALDVGLKVENETLLEALALDHANEVAVNLRLKGDQDTMLRWLLTLQSPEKFTAIKALELELDTRSKEKTPQAQCNLTVARWFNPMPPPAAAEPASLPAPEPMAEPLDPLTPQDLTSPLEISSPLETS